MVAIDTPNWVKSAVIYEVFPRNHSVSGTFMDVYRDLERIRSLHVDILWLMPIHPVGIVGRKGTMGSPYAIQDYRTINPELGDDRTFRMLIDKAHSLGMKVMIDVVYNHTSRDSVLLREHPEWFLQDSEGNFTTKVPDWWDVYDLDYRQTDLWTYQIETLKMWVDFGVDGFRCDVAPLVPLDFWLAARDKLGQDKEVIWLAESIEKSFVKYIRDMGYRVHGDPELHEAFDLTYDYDGFEYLKDYFQGRRPLTDYLNHLYIQETLYPEGAVKLRFLENHDNPRASDVIRGRDSLLNWTVFCALLPGATLIHAGQEIGLRRTPNLFEKDPVKWEDADYGLMSFMQKVLGFAKEIKGTCKTFAVGEPVEGAVKLTWLGDDIAYVALLNLANKYGEIHVEGLDAGEVCIGDAGDRGKFRMERMPVLVKIPAT